MKPIFITGATGNIGKYIPSHLQNRGEAVRLGLRNPDLQSTHEVPFDFSDTTTYRSAVEGCKAVFLLRPPAVANTKKTLNVFIDEAYASGVDHIVFVSVTGADKNSIVPHHAVEQKLIESRKSYTILRPGFFSQNLETAYRDDIVSANRIYLPSGKGLINFIDTRDIAEIAAKCLFEPAVHGGKAYMLAGNQAVSFYEVAMMLSDALHRPIKYEEASVYGYFTHVIRQGAPWMQALVQTVLHRGIRVGQANITDATAGRLLGRDPIPVEAYIKKTLTCGNHNLASPNRDIN